MKNPGTRRVIIGITLSFILWYIVFLTGVLGSFWFRVTLASIILAGYAQFNGVVRPETPTIINAGKGIISGLGLYTAFYLGFNLFRALLLTGAVNVYTFRDELPLIAPTIILLATSFCEEYFWRQYVQTNLVNEIGDKGVWVASILYAAIHIPTLNLPLVAAALIAGAFWGTIYHRSNSLWIVVFSHIVWTELIFVFMPLT